VRDVFRESGSDAESQDDDDDGRLVAEAGVAASVHRTSPAIV